MSTLKNEPHIVIGDDRVIVVPEELKKIAVQFDHNVETVTFDCPRYWDDVDLSTMNVYINYMLADGKLGSHLAGTPTVDASNPNLMHFDWTVSRNVTEMNGNLSFLVCLKKTDEDGNESNHWNSELCTDLFVSEGLECDQSIIIQYPDIVTDLLTRMEIVENIPAPTLTVEEIEGGYKLTANDYVNGERTFNILHGDTFKVVRLI